MNKDIELINIVLEDYNKEIYNLFLQMNTVIQEFDGVKPQLIANTPAIHIKEFYRNNTFIDTDLRKIFVDEFSKLSQSVKKVQLYISEINDEDIYLKSVSLKRMLGNIADCENTYFKSVTKHDVNTRVRNVEEIIEETQNMKNTIDKFTNLYCGVSIPSNN